MSHEERPGYYKDKDGIWQKDRRKGGERRRGRAGIEHHDRRALRRRKEDREILETDHLRMIEDALEDFAEEHPRHHE